MKRSLALPASTLESSTYACSPNDGDAPSAASPSAATVTYAPAGSAGRFVKSARPPSGVVQLDEPGGTRRTSYCAAGSARYFVTFEYDRPAGAPFDAKTGPVNLFVPCSATQKSTAGASGERCATRSCASLEPVVVVG